MRSMTYDWDRREMVLVESDLHFGQPIQLWTWDGAAWRQRSFSGGPTGPVPVIAFDMQRRSLIAITGGCSGSHCGAQTWSWDGRTWNKLTPSIEPGFAFSSMSLVPDPISKGLVLLTVSSDTPGPVPTETWIWDGQEWSQMQLIGQQGAEVNAVVATRDGVHGTVLAFEDVTRDFKTVRIDAWEWSGNSWKTINDSKASSSP
jgi:hypothetical protein